MRAAQFLILLLPFLASCAAQAGHPAAANGAAGNGGRDGSSVDRAIVIQASNEFGGDADENVYLEQQYPGYKEISQALIESSGRQYDMIDLTTADGKKLTVYFDVTSFFGR
jgi:hypothetical protein